MSRRSSKRKKKALGASVGVLAVAGIGASALGTGVIGGLPSAAASTCYVTSHAKAEATLNIAVVGGEQEMAEIDLQTRQAFDCKSGNLGAFSIQARGCYAWFDADATSIVNCSYTTQSPKSYTKVNLDGSFASDLYQGVAWGLHGHTYFYERSNVAPQQQDYCTYTNAPNHSVDNVHCFAGAGPL